MAFFEDATEPEDVVVQNASLEAERFYEITAIKEVRSLVPEKVSKGFSFQSAPDPETGKVHPASKRQRITYKEAVHYEAEGIGPPSTNHVVDRRELHEQCTQFLKQGYDLHICFRDQPTVIIVSVSSMPYAGFGMFAAGPIVPNQMIVPYFGNDTQEKGIYTIEKNRGGALLDGIGSKTCAWAANTQRQSENLSVAAGINNAKFESGTNRKGVFYYPKIVSLKQIAAGAEIFVAYGKNHIVQPKHAKVDISNPNLRLKILPLFKPVSAERKDYNAFLGAVKQNMQTKLCVEVAASALKRSEVKPEHYIVFTEKLEIVDEETKADYHARNGDDSTIQYNEVNYKLLDRATFGKTLFYCMNNVSSARGYDKPNAEDGIIPIGCNVTIEHRATYGKITVALPQSIDLSQAAVYELRWAYNPRAAFVDAFTDLSIA